MGPLIDCPMYTGPLCVCMKGLVFNDCIQECVEPEKCPALCELEKCIGWPESHDHCDRSDKSDSVFCQVAATPTEIHIVIETYNISYIRENE